MHGGERLGEPSNSRKENGADLANVATDQEADKCLHVGVDAPSFLNGRYNGGEVVIG